MRRLEEFRNAVNGEEGRDYFPVDSYVNKSYLDYSLSVILQRAIPDVRDGLKPVHRRILYAMMKLGLLPGASHKKSARVVGDVIGKYHPHGDQSVYDAMVLMAQTFNLRHPFIDGQGNWGSLDGDSPAAMRYTECRLSPVASLLLDEVEKGTVDFRPNYDGNDMEPSVLPARLPMVLLNDQMGIAVGYASDIPGHNIREVAAASIALYRNPDAKLPAILNFIKGPDFSCGGQITTSAEELKEIYASGQGMITVRSRYEVKKDADGGWYLVFTELPPKVSPESVLLEVDAISNPQPKKGKDIKSQKGEGRITADQKNAKDLMLARVAEVQNGAGSGTGPVHLEFYPKSNRQKPDELALYLYSVTSLESRLKVNMNMLDLTGRPRRMGLLDVLRDWNAFRFDTVTKRCGAKLEKVEARLHILDGFLKILLDIDEVIKVIRASDDDKAAKAALMERWLLTGTQADRVLDMKLRQLTRLDELAIGRERDGLLEEKAAMEKVLGDRKAMTELIISELTADAKKYGNPRRTMIEEAEPASFDEPVSDEPVTIILSRKGWLRSRVGHGLDLTGLTFKDGDGEHTIIETRTARQLLLADENGRFYTVGAGMLPGGRGDGVPAASLIDIQDKANIVALFTAEAGENYLLASTTGYGFITGAGNFFARNKAGKAVMNVGEGKALPPIKIDPGAKSVAVFNSAGYFLVFGLDEVGEIPKGKGFKLLNLKKGEQLAALAVAGEALTLPGKRGRNPVVLKGPALEDYKRKRGGRGRPLPKNALPPAHGSQIDPGTEPAVPDAPAEQEPRPRQPAQTDLLALLESAAETVKERE